MAIKFYLGNPNSTGDWFDWIGPDHSDQLGAKMKKMFETQINLSQTDDGQRILEDLAGPHTWEQEMLVQGYLFYPWGESCSEPCQPPDNSHPLHLRGDWLPLSQLKKYCESFVCDGFLIPPRQLWLCLQAPSEQITATLPLYSGEEFEESLIQHMLLTNKPVLATAEMATGQRKLFFIAPDDWLQRSL